jgi:hypothetical protein
MRSARHSEVNQKSLRFLGAAALAVISVAPLAASTAASATSNSSTSTTAHESLTAHATLVCGSITFEYSAGNPVTYIQIHATGVSCALAKSVIVRGGKWHAKAPAGWTYINGKFLDNGAGNCGFTWKRGADRITGWIVNPGEGC